MRSWPSFRRVQMPCSQRVERQVGAQRGGDAPANDPADRVEDESDVDEADPGRDVGDVGYPSGVGCRRRRSPGSTHPRAGDRPPGSWCGAACGHRRPLPSGPVPSSGAPRCTVPLAHTSARSAGRAQSRGVVAGSAPSTSSGPRRPGSCRRTTPRRARPADRAEVLRQCGTVHRGAPDEGTGLKGAVAVAHKRPRTTMPGVHRRPEDALNRDF